MPSVIKQLIKKSFNLFGFDLYRYPRIRGVIVRSAVEYNQENITNFYTDPKYWKNYLEKSGYQYYAMMRELLKEKGININGKSCCDVGCGTGYFLLTLRNNYTSLSLTGFDVVKSAVALAKKTEPGSDIYLGNILKPDRQKKFDVVFCTEVLEHILQAEQALKNLIAMTNKSGVCIIGVPNGREDDYQGHINFWSPESWEFFIKRTCKGCDIDTGVWNNHKNNYAIIKPLNIES
jgi:2-polyprenyl-3-methyl-5-hydroxy-6-metoxy-1,4-benzoquinol methylase